MADIRHVQTKFWDDPWIEDLDPLYKLLYLYLITNKYNNLAGIFEITIKRIVYETGINKEIVLKGLVLFAKDKKVFKVDNYIILINWLKNQKFNGNMQKGAMSILKKLPNPVKNKAFGNDYQTLLKDYQTLSNSWLNAEKGESKELTLDFSRGDHSISPPPPSKSVINTPPESHTIQLEGKRGDNKKAVNDLMNYFKFNEINNYNQLREISSFVNGLIDSNRIEHFENQFSAYKQYKEKSKQKPHLFKGFISGGWDDNNWIELLKNLNQDDQHSDKPKKTKADEELERALGSRKNATSGH